jgi:hypothetical protein
MDIPTLDAELSLIYRIGLAGNGIDNSTIQHLQVKAASATTVGARSEYSPVIHNVS